MCVYIHIYVYTHVCMYVYTYICIHTFQIEPGAVLEEQYSTPEIANINSIWEINKS